MPVAIMMYCTSTTKWLIYLLHQYYEMTDTKEIDPVIIENRKMSWWQILSSLVATEVIIMTNYDAKNDNCQVSVVFFVAWSLQT